MRVLVGSKFPTGRASGMMMVRPAKVRFSIGRFVISLGVTTPLMSDFVVSMSGESAVTSTASRQVADREVEAEGHARCRRSPAPRGASPS